MAVWCPSAAGCLAVCLGAALLLAPSLAAPAPDTPWWHNPCNKQVERIRHERSAAHDIVKIQLRSFATQLNNHLLKDLSALYRGVAKSSTSFGRMSWLRVAKMLRLMKPQKTRLVKFHEALQFFAGTIEVLSNIEIRTNTTNFRNDLRQELYSTAAKYLKLLLCEVEYTLDHGSKRVPVKVPLKRIGVRLEPSLDLTRVHPLDITFFRKMKNFVNRSQRLFRVKKRVNKSGKVKAKKRTKVQAF